jgi:hypothetical protein
MIPPRSLYFTTILFPRSLTALAPATLHLLHIMIRITILNYPTRLSLGDRTHL